MMLSRIGEIRILLKQLTLRVAEKSFNCAKGPLERDLDSVVSES